MFRTETAHARTLIPVIGLLIIGLCLVSLIATPVMAGVKYLSGEPNLSATISGSNEFVPGDSTELTILIQNTGLNNMKMVQSGIVDRDDLPSTAKMVHATLLPDGAPILIKSDSQMIGDIKGSESVPVTFQIRVQDDGKAGSYALPLMLEYIYLADAEQMGTDSVVNRYSSKTVTIEVPFVVKSAINLDVLSVTPSDINAGGEGYVTLLLKNGGTATGYKAIAKLNRSGSSPVVPVDGTVYVGEFTPGQEVEANFKVSVTRDAEPQVYPMEVLVSYENIDGEKLDTPVESFGIPVGGKIEFTITGENPRVTPGGKQVIDVTYRNDGGATAYSAEARLSAVDPFSSNDDLAYLGDIAPGESAVARYELSTGSDAVDKTYGLDSEVRYRDALGNSQISDTVKVQLEVVPPDGLAALLKNPLVIAVVLILIIGGAYYTFNQRKKSVC